MRILNFGFAICVCVGLGVCPIVGVIDEVQSQNVDRRQWLFGSYFQLFFVSFFFSCLCFFSAADIKFEKSTHVTHGMPLFGLQLERESNGTSAPPTASHSKHYSICVCFYVSTRCYLAHFHSHLFSDVEMDRKRDFYLCHQCLAPAASIFVVDVAPFT